MDPVAVVLRSSVSKAAAPILRVVSARHRRWNRVLSSCRLDLDDLPPVLPAPSADDVIICGSPRTGTAVLTAQLHRPPHTIGVMEPWDVLRMPPEELFDSIRTEAETGLMRRGRLDLDALEQRGAVVWCREGRVSRPIEYRPDTLVAIKYPGMWRYLDRLPTTRFIVCLRNPVDTIRSFRTTGGRLREGLQYDVPFEASLNQMLRSTYRDPARRRVALYDTINQAILPHLGRPEVFVVRYERWFEDAEQLIVELGEFLGRDLGDRSLVDLKRPAVREPTEEDAYIKAHCSTAKALGY